MSTEANEVKREPGFYWLLNAGEWIVGEWTGGAWYLCGLEDRREDSRFTRIGLPCINPIERPLDAVVEAFVSMAIADVFQSAEFKSRLSAAVEKAREESRDVR